MNTIDFRSDTVTKPCSAMRQAIATCEVGDDMMGEDPTVNKLQEIAAAKLGKEAALLVPSGTMANSISVKIHTQPGEAVAMLPRAHIYCYEAGGAVMLSGVTILPIGNDAGVITPEQLLTVMPPDDQHYAPLTTLCLENTHNGNVVPLEDIAKIHEVCRHHNISMHLDGARIFNASVKSGIPAHEYAKYFDTISFCLSKGLGAPIGSMICGSHDWIKKAHRMRKKLGGAMRQAGIIAAAGIYALENNIERLAEDHRRAQYIAENIASLPGIVLLNEVTTNMIFVKYAEEIDTQKLEQHMQQNHIKMHVDHKIKISRIVTHLDIDDQAMESLVNCFKEFLLSHNI